jgi:hypothetical protein
MITGLAGASIWSEDLNNLLPFLITGAVIPIDVDHLAGAGLR